MLEKLKYDEATAIPFRAMALGIGGMTNFAIVNLCIKDVRDRSQYVPIEPIEHGKSGDVVKTNAAGDIVSVQPTIDHANEALAEVAARQEESRVREEQGHATTFPPLVLAGLLMVIRNSLQEELRAHARIEKLHDGTPVRNKWDMLQSLDDELTRQITRTPAVDLNKIEAMQAATGIDRDSLILAQQRSASGARKFLIDNEDEIRNRLTGLVALNPDGHEYRLDEAEQVEERLPAHMRARIIIAADQGLSRERIRWVNLLVKAHPDAGGNIALLDAERRMVHKAFEFFMSKPTVKQELRLALENQQISAWPQIEPLPITSGQAAGMEAAVTARRLAQRA